MGVCVCVCLYFDVLISSSLSMVRSFPAYLRKKKKKAYISSQLAGIFLVISMALSSVFRRINVKDLTSKVSDYTSATELSGGLNMIFRRWATKKTAGSTKNGRDSNPKYLGVKKFGGEKVLPENIIVRQRGTRFHPGNYVGMGKDHTLFCLKEGHVRFERNKLSGRKWVHVDPVAGHDLHPIYADGFATTADTEPLQ